MPTNTGIPYEKLTQHIFNQIVNQNLVPTIKVEHDVLLQGKSSATHQIDVYWELKIGGIKHSVVVQAKDWRTQRVNQGELFKFKCVLDDLPDQPRGVFVTRTGYQSGARKFAEHHRIYLYELRELTDADWEGAIKIINYTLIMFVPHYDGVTLIQDIEWINKERERLQMLEGAAEIEIPNDVTFYDENDQEIGTVQSVVASLAPLESQEMIPTKKTHTFDKPAFIRTDIPKFPKVKINAVETTVSVSKSVEDFSIDIGDFVGFVLKNVIEDDQEIFDKDANLIK
jgi:hypothetical protein